MARRALAGLCLRSCGLLEQRLAASSSASDVCSTSQRLFGGAESLRGWSGQAVQVPTPEGPSFASYGLSGGQTKNLQEYDRQAHRLVGLEISMGPALVRSRTSGRRVSPLQSRLLGAGIASNCAPAT